MDKEKVQHSTPSVAPVSANTNDDAAANVDESVHPKSIGKDVGGAEGGGGGGGKSRTTGLGAFAAAFGTKQPTNFFELLAAAISATKLEQQKGPDFIEYLRRSGIRMAWVRAIVALYEEPKKPDDPLAYIVRLMGLGVPEPIDVKRMQDQVARLRVKHISLQMENAALRQAIEIEEEALQQKDELLSLYDESKYFSDYNSDDDYSGAEETQQHQSYIKPQ